MSPWAAEAAAISSDGSARELRFFMTLENMDATLHDNFEKEHREARKLVRNAHSCVFPIDNGCRLDLSCVLEVGDEELTSRFPQGVRRISTWRFSKALAWRPKSSAEKRTAKEFSQENCNPTPEWAATNF